MNKIDCFAYNGKRGKYCDVTMRKNCKDCTFYKTRKQFDLDVERAKYLNSLPKNKVLPDFRWKE